MSKSLRLDSFMDMTYVKDIKDICNIFDLFLSHRTQKNVIQKSYDYRKIVMIILLCHRVEPDEMLSIQNADIQEDMISLSGKKIKINLAFKKYIINYKEHLSLLPYESLSLCEDIKGEKITTATQLLGVLNTLSYIVNTYIDHYKNYPIERMRTRDLVRSYNFYEVLQDANKRNNKDFIGLLKKYCSSTYAFSTDVDLRINEICDLYNKWLSYFYKDLESELYVSVTQNETLRNEGFFDVEQESNNLGDKLVVLPRNKLKEFECKMYDTIQMQNISFNVQNNIAEVQNLLKLLFLQVSFDFVDITEDSLNNWIVITLDFKDFMLTKQAISLLEELFNDCEVYLSSKKDVIIADLILKNTQNSNSILQNIKRNHTKLNIASSETVSKFDVFQNQISNMCENAFKQEELQFLNKKMLNFSLNSNIDSSNIEMTVCKNKITYLMFTSNFIVNSQLLLFELFYSLSFIEIKQTLDGGWRYRFEVNY